MVIRVDSTVITFLTAQQLNSAVRNNFIRVHVEGFPGAALNRVNDKCLTEFSRQNLVTDPDDHIRYLAIQRPNFAIRDSCRLFDIDQVDVVIRVNITAQKIIFSSF